MENPRRISSDSLSQTHNDSIGTSSMLGSPTCPSEPSPTISGASTVTSPAPQTQSGNNEVQQQFMQQQAQMLKMLEQKLIETQMMQQTLMQQIARPETLASGMLSQLGQFQVAATNSPQFPANAAQSTLNQLPTTHSQNTQNSQLETLTPGLTTTSTSPNVSNTQKGSVLSQPMTVGRLGQQLNAGQQVPSQSQQQYSNSSGHPQFQVPVLGNRQSNVLHLQAPNIQIKLAQPQYVLQASSSKSNTTTSTTQAEVQNTSSQQVSEQKPKSHVTKTNQSTEMTGQTIHISEQNVLRHFAKDEIAQAQTTDQSNMVKIGNQIHQVINLHPHQLSQVVAQPIQLQNIRPNLQGLRIPVLQPAQRAQQPQNQQVPFYPHDTSRPQLPQFVTVAPLNPEQLQQRGIQNICVPARLPVGSPISLEQLQQMFVQSQRHTEASVQQVNKVSAQTPETKENSVVSSQQSQLLGKEVSTSPSQGAKSAESLTCMPPGKEQCSSTQSLQRHKNETSDPSSVCNAASQSDNVTQCSTVNSAVETSIGPVPFHSLSAVRQHSQEQKPSLSASSIATDDSTKINFNELDSHGLSEFAHLQNVGQCHDSSHGQTGPNSQGVNCALVVQSVPSTNTENLRSGHQTPSSELDEMLRSFVINRHGDFDLVSPLPDNITRSRNNSGESTIEPTISVDMSSFPRELLSIIAPQALTITISNGQSHNSGQ
ncbi:chromatin modification-related protein eaf-1-like isoform X1 [Haliotis rubra]|uniref:chromatin modification-related protein eaf-1-like isoform X1 n=1 Tax=Haliotis rubra TaxID=36100 RepID=UPI001EE57C52|nr:chromatin modification-related protein eaf-1-like isoform X1 [Haliotis rubra]